VAGQSTATTAITLGTLGVIGIAWSAPRLLPRGTFRGGTGLPSAVALRGMASAAFVGAEVFIPLLLVRERGLSPAAAGLALTIGALTWSLGSWLQGRGALPDRRFRLRAGMAFLGTGIAATAALVADMVPLPLGISAWALSGLGMGLVYPTLSVLVLEFSSPTDQGRNTSSLQISDALFTTLMLALTGTAFTALLEISSSWSYVAGFVLAGGIAVGGIGVAGRVLPRDEPAIAAVTGATSHGH
jgi:MFS family permease